MSKPTAISLFAGGGGMSVGLRDAGFRTILLTDVEKSASHTLEYNFPRATVLNADVRRITKEELQRLVGSEEVDLIAGGPPCQGFSTIGDQNPADPRNGLFWCFVRIVQWLRPKCFLMENVNYLRTQYGGRYEKEIIDAFERIGYSVAVQTLNSADYGVPQVRKRVFFFGSRIGSDFQWPEITHGPGASSYRTVGDAIGDLIEGDQTVQNHSFLNHGNTVVSRYKLIPEGGRMPPPSELPVELRRKNFGNTYKRLHRGRPSLTLVPGNNAFPIHPVEHRSLSPREAARIQTFPDNYVFFGTRAEQCRLVGNAVPPLMAQRLGESIKHHMKKNSGSNSRAAVDCVDSGHPLRTFARPSFPSNGLTAVSFFSGIGGMTLGFVNAGFEVLASYDLKNSVHKNMDVNFPDIPHYKRDVTEVTSSEVRGAVKGRTIDVVFGGPPCQGFSIFGRRRFVNTKNHKPEDDERNEVSIKFVKLAVELEPKCIVLENVKGFISTPRGDSSYIDEVESILLASGYGFEYRVVNCASYGVPQARERLILVASKAGIEFEWPEPKYFSEPKPWQRSYVTVGDVISDLQDGASQSAEFSHVPMNHKELVVERYKLIPEGGKLPEGGLPENLRKGYRSDNVKNYSHIYKRLSMNLPATTMVPGHNAFPVHPRLHRTLTVREAARIQTFPDWMQFIGTRQQQCTLVGNAVPPLLAEIFASKVAKAIKGNSLSKGYKRDVYDLAAEKP